ncbi:MAG: thioredoxin family protein [Pseudomonadota bacterium]
MKRLALAFALALPLVAIPALAQSEEAATAGPFDPQVDASTALARALATARVRMAATDDAAGPQRVLAIFGANWCHDSRDLAAMLASPRMAELIARHYQVVLIDAGMPQTGNGLNLDLAARHGVDDVTGTPTVLVLDAHGELLNSPDNARGWRNASSRSEREVTRFLRQWVRQ